MIMQLHKHDCSRCVFLGRNSPKPEDVYFCEGENSIVVRCSEDGPDYKSFSLSLARQIAASSENEWVLPVALTEAYLRGRGLSL